MKISDIFNIKSGNNFALMHTEETENSYINLVSSTSKNNGIIKKVNEHKNIRPFAAGLISVAVNGSVLSTFVQTKPFCTITDVKVLEPKESMNFNEKFFYAMCIKKNAFRYNFGRQANKTLKDIDLPDNIPSWIKSYNFEKLESCIKNIEIWR